MKIWFLLLLIILPLAALSGDDAIYIEDILLPEYSRSYDPARDPFEDGKEALLYAKETNRRVLIKVGGDWCSYCRILDHFVDNNPLVRNSLHEKFVVLKVNISDENTNEDFMSGLPETIGYPHIFITGNDGQILISKDTARLLVNGQYSQEYFLDFLSEWGP